MSATHYGKGSSVRPSLVSKEQFSNNWDNIFKKKETNTLDEFSIIIPKNEDLYTGTGFYIIDDKLVDYPSQKVIAKKVGERDLSEIYSVDVKTLLEVLDSNLVYNEEDEEFVVYSKTKTFYCFARINTFRNDGRLKLSDIALSRNLYNLPIYK